MLKFYYLGVFFSCLLVYTLLKPYDHTITKGHLILNLFQEHLKLVLEEKNNLEKKNFQLIFGLARVRQMGKQFELFVARDQTPLGNAPVALE